VVKKSSIELTALDGGASRKTLMHHRWLEQVAAGDSIAQKRDRDPCDMTDSTIETAGSGRNPNGLRKRSNKPKAIKKAVRLDVPIR